MDDHKKREILLAVLADDPRDAEDLLTEYEASKRSGGFGAAPASHLLMSIVPFLQTSIDVAASAIDAGTWGQSIAASLIAAAIYDHLKEYWSQQPDPKPKDANELMRRVAERTAEEIKKDEEQSS